MKTNYRKYSIGIILGSTSLFALGTASADETSNNGENASLPSEEVIDSINDTEKAKKNPRLKKQRERLLRRFDEDGDGKLSDEEKAKAKEAMKERKERRAERLEKFDADGDGKLNEQERLTAFKTNLENNPKKKAKIIERFDEDNDGELSDSELEKARAYLKEKRETKRPSSKSKRPGKE